MLLAALGLLAVWFCAPELAPAAAFLCCAAYMAVDLHSCIHSCKGLLKFWFVESLLFSVSGGGVLLDFIPNQAVNEVGVYCLFILIFTLFWGVSAGIADFEAAKMAGSIVNTGTTILLLAGNVLLTWCKQALSSAEMTETMQAQLQFGINVILLPLVVAGYLVALFVEGQNYYLRRQEK